MKIFQPIFENHISRNIHSPITQSKYIIPIVNEDFKPFSSNGFTVTAWVKIIEKGEKSLNEKQEERNVEQDHLHFISIGNAKLLFSVYIDQNDGSSLYLHLSRPNGESRSQIQSPDRSNVPLSSTSEAAQSSSNGNSSRQVRKRFKNTTPTNQGLNVLLESGDNCPNASPIQETPSINSDDTNPRVTVMQDSRILAQASQALKNSKSLLRSSLSSLNIFSRTSKSNSNRLEEIKPIQIHNIKLTRGKWIHLCLAVETLDNGIVVKITIDGTEQEAIKIYCSGSTFSNLKKMKPNFCMLGENCENNDDEENLRVKYSISNMMIFKEALKDFSVVATLTSLGPDVINFNSSMVS